MEITNTSPLKNNTMPRIHPHVNFNGNAEEASRPPAKTVIKKISCKER
jgi:hypothetical protein